MQNPNEDTEWNDVLRAKGIIPEKPKEAEVTEDQLLAMVEQTIKEKSGKKDLDMTSQDSSGFVKARKGVGSSARVSGRKGVEDNLVTPEPEITTFSTQSSFL